MILAVISCDILHIYVILFVDDNITVHHGYSVTDLADHCSETITINIASGFPIKDITKQIKNTILRDFLFLLLRAKGE